MQLCADIASGMTYLHAKDFLHRDLTSKNCLIRRPKATSSHAVSGAAGGRGGGKGGGGVGRSGGSSDTKKIENERADNQNDGCQDLQLPRCLGRDLLGKDDDDDDDDDDGYDRLQAVICDYGLATKIPDPKCKVVKRLSIKGHPYWMSPECMTGKDYNKVSWMARKSKYRRLRIFKCEVRKSMPKLI